MIVNILLGVGIFVLGITIHRLIARLQKLESRLDSLESDFNFLLGNLSKIIPFAPWRYRLNKRTRKG